MNLSVGDVEDWRWNRPSENDDDLQRPLASRAAPVSWHRPGSGRDSRYAPDDPVLPVDGLPRAIRDLLWSYRLEAGGTLPVAIVAAAVMERGELAAMRWLRRTIEAGTLIRLLPGIARRLSPRSLALWCCLLDCPMPAVDRVPWTAA